MKWSKEKIEKAKKIARTCSSLNEVASKLGVSRDSLVGAFQRAGERVGDYFAQPPAPSTLAVEEDPTIEKLVKLTAKDAVSLETACDAVNLSPRALRSLVQVAASAGHQISIDGWHIGQRPKAPTRLVTLPQTVGGGIFGSASDIHIGNIHHKRDALEDFTERAYTRGVRTMLQPGDLLDGVYKHSVWEQSHRGFKEQAELAAEILPQRPGMKWFFILGNHDETFEQGSGMDVGPALVSTFKRRGRTDLVYLGSRGATVRLKGEGEKRGMLVELWHPRGNGAYALSYKLQRKVAEYQPGQKPDAVFAGHWHQQCYFTTRGVHCHLAGTFQGGLSPFGRSIGGTPAIGGWIVKYALTADGTVREYDPSWISYYEQEAPRDLRLPRAAKI